MSGYSQTSREAFNRVDVTAGQRRVLKHFRSGMTRQDIADASGIPINVVCPRVKEMIDDGVMRELPAVDGKHPLELHPPEARTEIGAVSGKPHGEDSGASPRNLQAKKNSVYVTPSCFVNSHPSLSVASAKLVIKDKGNAYYAEAEKVLRDGEHTVYS